MFTKQNLLDHLQAIGVDPKGTLKVHVSYKSIGEVEGKGDTVLAALMEYMKGGLLVMASHTWDSVRETNPVMDVLHTPSCVGILTELFRKKEGVYRSLHPTHAVAAYGRDAASFVSGEEKIGTPCGEGGAYHKLWKRDAQILLIGVNFTRNTFIHGIEEWDHAQGTISDKTEEYFVIDHFGQRIATPQNRHCAELGSETFSKLEPDAINQGIVTLGKFGNATTRLMGAKAIREMTAKLLKADPLYLNQY